jgi:hypothetical protein
LAAYADTIPTFLDDILDGSTRGKLSNGRRGEFALY